MRRAAYVLTLALAIAAPAPAMEELPLRDLASYSDFHIGAAVAPGPLVNDASYAQQLALEFNMLVPENAMKFQGVRDATGYDFTDADAIVDFAERHQMAVRGHTLLWHLSLPEWLTDDPPQGEALADFARDHIQTVVSRYKGRVHYWDVVNEALSDDEGHGLRESLWLAMGTDYVERAHRWAHEADPDAKLFYNDYGAEGLSTKSDAVYAFVKDFVERGVPIHGVGLQAHFDLETAPSKEDMIANIQRLGELGLEVHITELDVRVPVPASTESLERQAGIYRNVMEACLACDNCTAVLTWGFTDRHSWIPHFYDGFGAALPFDANYQRKPAWHALAEALRAKAYDRTD